MLSLLQDDSTAKKKIICFAGFKNHFTVCLVFIWSFSNIVQLLINVPENYSLGFLQEKQEFPQQFYTFFLQFCINNVFFNPDLTD